MKSTAMFWDEPLRIQHKLRGVSKKLNASFFSVED
jgi:hypothetical protein